MVTLAAQSLVVPQMSGCKLTEMVSNRNECHRRRDKLCQHLADLF